MNRHVFEPHGDDAVISCFPILEESTRHNIKTNVVTLSDRPSTGLSDWFPNVTTEYWDLYGISYFLVRMYYHEFAAWLKNTRNGHENAWDWQLRETMIKGSNLWIESYWMLEEALEAYFNNIPAGDQIFVPVGLLHPYHIAVSRACNRLVRLRPDLDFIYYSEAPYNHNKWVQVIEQSHPLLPREPSNADPPTEDYKFKQKVFEALYPTEVPMFFRFTFDQVIRNPYRFYNAYSPIGLS